MNRRSFIFKSAGLTVSVLAFPSLSLAAPKRKLDRIAMGTVLFRNRFRQTRSEALSGDYDELRLLDVPEFYRDRFGLNQVEFWSYHFESLEPAYLKELKKSLQAARSSLVNVQVDTRYNLAAEDEAERQESIRHVKEWIDATAYLQSPAVRINPGKGSVEKSIASLKEVNQYAKSKKLALLTENHFGLEMDPSVHVRIIKEVGPNIYTLPDFGNYPDEIRFEALEKILPYAYLVSAKAAHFNDQLEHTSYDFDRCVRLCEENGFKGVYSVEQWSPEQPDADYEKIGDWLIEHVERNI